MSSPPQSTWGSGESGGLDSDLGTNIDNTSTLQSDVDLEFSELDLIQDFSFDVEQLRWELPARARILWRTRGPPVPPLQDLITRSTHAAAATGLLFQGVKMPH